MERETILFDVDANVATITLNRPDQLNSFNDVMATDMTWAWETVRDTDAI
jgi:E-phenylitaconyl-CoA hydratase